jgi:hypothetical protein
MWPTRSVRTRTTHVNGKVHEIAMPCAVRNQQAIARVQKHAANHGESPFCDCRMEGLPESD